jgi:RHS repeat-associated protein
MRNAAGTVRNCYFWFGACINGINYCYSKDYLGSIRSLCDSTGTSQAEYSYDLFGQTSVVLESVSSDFQFAGYYKHRRSGLNLTLYRAFKADTGSWLSRDPIENINPYYYANNNPVGYVDRLGLMASMPGGVLAAGPGGGKGGTGGGKGAAGGGGCPPPGGKTSKNPFIEHGPHNDCQWMWDEILRLMTALDKRNYELRRDIQNLFIYNYSRQLPGYYGNYLIHEQAAHEAKSSLAQMVRLAQQEDCPIPPGASWLLNSPIPEAPDWVVKTIPNWRQVFRGIH